ncbi:MAG: hypothetical protein HFE46_07345 [Clostridia bacterium]|nr:hypothetical protein [Clostridia bacterium]
MIEVKTIWSEALLQKCNAAQSRRRLWLPLVVMTVLAAAGIACLFVDGLGVVCGVPVLCIAAAVPVAYLAISHFWVRNMVRKSAAVQNQTTQIVRFTDAIMVNQSNKYTAAQDVRFSYDEIAKAYEREEAFYLHVGAQTYILDAKGFRMGTRRDLHDVLFARLGAKRFHWQSRLYAKK